LADRHQTLAPKMFGGDPDLQTRTDRQYLYDTNIADLRDLLKTGD